MHGDVGTCKITLLELAGTLREPLGKHRFATVERRPLMMRSKSLGDPIVTG